MDVQPLGFTLAATEDSPDTSFHILTKQPFACAAALRAQYNRPGMDNQHSKDKIVTCSTFFVL